MARGRTLRRAIGVSALALLLLVPTPAHAGGWWSNIDLRSQYLVQGHTAQAGTEFLFASIDAAERAHRTGRFFAYLIVGLDWGMVEEATSGPEPRRWWNIDDARAIRVGSVTLRGRDSNLATASARFVVPATLDPGWYALMLCDAGCENPLGDIVPSRVRVVASSLEARLARRVDELSRRAQVQAHAIRRLRTAVGATEDTDRLIGELRARVAVLESRLQQRTEHAEPPPAPAAARDESLPWWSVAGWFLAGAVTIGLVRVVALRRRRPRRPTEPEGLDEELEALVRERVDSG